jgi:hypothetical protein
MCYNFATFVLYLDVITLIYRENRLTSSEPCLSARLIEYSPVEFILWDFFYDNQSKFLEKVVISLGDKSCI